MALDAVRARDTRVQGVRAHASADHFGTQGRIRGAVYIFVQRPSSLRVDTTAFGNTVSALATDGQTFAMADMRQSTFFRGPAEPCVAAQLLGIPLEAGEVVALMAGGPPLLQGNPRIRWDDGHYVVDIAGQNGRSESVTMEITDAERQSARPDQQHPRPTRAVLRDARGERAVLTFEDYRDVNGVAFPYRVRVVMERDNVDLQVRYDEVEINPDLPPDAFALEPTAGMREVAVTCAQQPPSPAPSPPPSPPPPPPSRRALRPRAPGAFRC